MSRDYKPLPLRLPPELRARLEHYAEVNHRRSMNETLTFILDSWLTQWDTERQALLNQIDRINVAIEQSEADR